MKYTLAKTVTVLLVVTATTPAVAQAPNPWNDRPMRRFVVYWSWLWYAGHGLNSTTLNGELPDGSKVTSVSLSGVTVKGKAMKKVLLHGTRFWGVAAHGKVAGPWAFKGARFTASVDDGTSLELRVDRVFRGKEKKIRDILYYEVSYRDSSQWQPLCGSENNGDPVLAIPLKGAWSYKAGVTGGGSRLSTPGVFTFACVGHVLAKCTEGGYRPWLAARRCTKGKGCKLVTLARYHQACTRLLRADFCGDGIHHTVEDTRVNMFGGPGIRTDTVNWSFEAEWDADGAVCASSVRVSGSQPKCMSRLQDKTCGAAAHLQQDGLLFSEIPPAE